jgi:hypothetical protein
MARETRPVMLVITSSPARDAGSSVTSVCRLLGFRHFTQVFAGLWPAVLSDLM